jgi:PAS domain S-box-containing protein
MSAASAFKLDVISVTCAIAMEEGTRGGAPRRAVPGLASWVAGTMITVLVVLVGPGLWIAARLIEDAVMDEDLRVLARTHDSWTHRINDRLIESEASAARFSRMVTAELTDERATNAGGFDELVERTADGSLLTRKDGFNVTRDAVLWVPPSYKVDDAERRFLLVAKRMTELYRADNNPYWINNWVLPIQNGLVMFWPSRAGYIDGFDTSIDFTSTEWVTLASPQQNPEGKPRWTPTSYDPFARAWMVSVTAPFFRSGAFAGSVGHDLTVDSLMESIRELAIYPGSQHIVARSDGTLLVSSAHQKRIHEGKGALSIAALDDERLERGFAASKAGAGGGARVVTSVDPEHVFVTTHLATPDWYVLTRVPRSALLASVKASYQRYWLAGAAAILAMLLLPILVISRVTLPSFRRLVAAAERIRAGDLEQRFEVSGSARELVQIGEVLNAMAETVATDQRRLQEQGRQIRLLLDSTAEAIVGLDAEGRCTFVNRAALALFGVTEAELLSKPLVSLEHPPWRPEPEPEGRSSFIRESLATGAAVHVTDMTLRRKDGTSITAECWSHPIHQDDGVVGVVVTAIDVTARKEAEELRKRAEELEIVSRQVQEANRLKSEFLANMSHELRTPLNAIIGFAGLMHDGKVGPLSDVHKEYMGDILSSGQHLLQLINDILDLAKIEAGKIELRPEPADLKAVVSEIKDVLRELAARQQIRIETEIDEALGPVVVDVAKIKQILYNYLSNALKFTPERGRVVVRVRSEDKDRFRIEVEDEGMGIEPEDLDQLFIPFQQLDASASKRHQGTGLGLALTKRIVEAHGGRVEVASTVGEGSTFSAVLPKFTAKAEEAPARPRPISTPSGGAGALAVLVIEDNERDRLWLSRTLTEAGYAVTAVATAAHALARCRERAFDAIAIDLLLQEDSSLDLLRRIREEEMNAATPVIALTVTSEHGVADGFVLHDILRKPLQEDALLASLKRAGVFPGAKRKILVIDDDPSACKIMEATLTMLGYHPIFRANGALGLTAVVEERPAAVVLDLLMPEMDGFEFLERFRFVYNAEAIPIFVWTVKDLSAEERSKLRASAQAIVQKGRSGVDALLDEIQRICSPRRAAEGATTKGGDDAAGEA